MRRPRLPLLLPVLLLTLLGATSAWTGEDEGKTGEKDEGDDGQLVVFSKEKPAPEASPDKALVVVVRPARIGFAIKSFFLVDDTPLGINKGSSYFFAHVEPGTRVFWSKSENVDAIELTVEAGKTYWFQQHVQVGALKARTKLEALSEEEGRRLLDKCGRSATLTERGRVRGLEIAREHKDATRKDLDRRARKAAEARP
jgi:hypothetical protein